MEYEVRFYYSFSKLDELIDKLRTLKLKESNRTYEKTIQYDHSNDEYSFYSKEVDGRFRLRISKCSDKDKCKLSWKRRLKDTRDQSVNKEEEKEVEINSDDFNNFIFIIENVLHMKRIESYERYRTNFYNDEIEISLDEYPFGMALEIESKGNNEVETVEKYVNKLDLNIKDSYRYSWDDKYEELCKKQNIEKLSDVLFDGIMPKVE